MGAGTFSLNRAAGNTYTGITTISAGTLLAMNTSGSATGTGAVTVNSGGVLGGTGAITGTVMVNSGGHIAPGASVESLDVGSLTLNAGANLDFEFDTVLGTGVSVLLNVTANNGLTINGGALNLVNAGTMTAGTYTLIDYSGTLNGSLGSLSLGVVPSGFTYNLVNDTTNQSINLVVTVPEPTNLLLLAVGALMLQLGTRASRLRTRRAALVCGI
jgi:autotransporter-associated beta strand protein